MSGSALIPFLGALGSPINPFKQKRGTLFNPSLLGNLVMALNNPILTALVVQGAEKWVAIGL